VGTQPGGSYELAIGDGNPMPSDLVGRIDQIIPRQRHRRLGRPTLNSEVDDGVEEGLFRGWIDFTDIQ